MLKFRRYLVTKLMAICRCQPGRIWVFFSLLVLLLVTLQAVEKLQPPRSCRCELERGLQQPTRHGQKRLQPPDLLREDRPLPWKRKAMPDPSPSTESAQDVFLMQPFFSQETPAERSPDDQEEHWPWEPEESSEKVKVHPSSEKGEVQISSKKVEVHPSSEKVKVHPSSRKVEVHPSSEKVEVHPSFKKVEVYPSSEKVEVQISSKKVEAYPSSEKVEAHPPSTKLKSQLPDLRTATLEAPPLSPSGRISAGLGGADAVTSKFIVFASAEEHRTTSPPATRQVVTQSQAQLQDLGTPDHQWDTRLKPSLPNSAQPPQAEDLFYETNTERGFIPSWTEASKGIEVTSGEDQQAKQTSSPRETCEPRTDIVFLKVHKSASSTVMNILFRFGETHNLTFAFPAGGGNQLYYPHPFLAKAVQGFSPGSPRRFNILCHHMRFLLPEVQKVVSSSAVYFSILRNPVQLMESSFMYYKGTSAFSRARTLEEFLSQPSRYYNPASGDRHYAKNLMAFDFGFNPDAEASPRRVQLMLEKIEASFDLLLISEYFEESMVLLKEKLCWDLDSVVFFPLNSRDAKTKATLSAATVEKIKDWNRLDWAIYTHFNRTFWERIERDLGRERMRREVRALRERQAELARLCLQGPGSVAPQDIRDSSLRPLQHGSARIVGYNIKQGLDEETERRCRRLVTPELQYSGALYKKQFAPKHPQTQRAAPSRPRHRLEGTQN